MSDTLTKIMARAICTAAPDTRSSMGASRAVLTALRAAGYAIVPREPTEAMCVKGEARGVIRGGTDGDDMLCVDVAYRAMIAEAEKETGK